MTVNRVRGEPKPNREKAVAVRSDRPVRDRASHVWWKGSKAVPDSRMIRPGNAVGHAEVVRT